MMRDVKMKCKDCRFLISGNDVVKMMRYPTQLRYEQEKHCIGSDYNREVLDINQECDVPTFPKRG